MTPPADRRQRNIWERAQPWLVPSLLALISVLLISGFNNLITSVQSQNADIKGMREDISALKVHYEDTRDWRSRVESRLADLEAPLADPRPNRRN